MIERIGMLDVDVELSEGLSAERLPLARRALVARLERVEVQTWAPGEDAFGVRGGFGLFIAEGLAVRRVSLGHRAAAELLGPGELLRPWEEDGEHVAFPFAASFRVMQPLSLLVLDPAFSLTLARFPEVVSRLVGRVMARSRRVVGHLVIAQFSSVQTRLHVVLWHLADRFGRVGPHGVTLHLPVTHEILGLIVGARRPAVTSALGRLADRGLVEALPNVGWRLKGEPPEELRPLRSAAVATPVR